ncbi:MAG: iron-containing alcohol dehydrogenase [Thermotogae bacterium]|nr:iron-containing alcohol dehydrogenase [Thermotogota bacterium]
MREWSFYMPTKVHFGERVLKREAGVIAVYGKNAFVVTGKSSSKRNSSLDDLLDILKELDLKVHIFDEVEENPTFSLVENAAEECRRVGADVVIGVGGGSPLDTAKAVAILAVNESLKPEELYDSSNYSHALPIIAVPTTAGTGSEVTQYSVLTSHEGRKGGFASPLNFPKHAFVDPRYTLTMPHELTTATAVDALSHAMEGILSSHSTPLSDTLAQKAVELIHEYLPRTLDESDNLEFRSKLMLASTLAGMVIAQTSTTVIHAMGYHLTTFKGLKHGTANGLIMVETLKHIRKFAPEVVEKALGPFESEEKLGEFLERVGIYGTDVTATEKELASWADVVLKASHVKRTPGIFTKNDIITIYARSLKQG